MGCGKSAQYKVDRVAQTGPCKSQLETLKMQKANAVAEDIRDKYDIEEVLGSGSFGQVRRARLNDNPSEVRAVKVIERDDNKKHARPAWSKQAVFVREVELLQQINHTNVIRYFDFYEDPHFLYVVMELCSGGEVFQKLLELKRFQESDASFIGRQMLSAIDYIHSLGICHRDIKAENFMFSGDSISSPLKMIDFGMATKFKLNEVLTELCGSPHYLSPELIGQKYNHYVDIWAFGVLLYLLLYGRYPYDGHNPQDIMAKILSEPIKWRHDKAKLSGNAIHLLTKVLERVPTKRISTQDALKHIWMQPQQPAKDDTVETSIPTDVLRSAHRRTSATRKQVDKKVEELRNLKLKEIDEAFSKGIRYGNRIGPTPQDATFLQMPEFVRRDNKLTTAPSSEVGQRDKYMEKMICLQEDDENEDGKLRDLRMISKVSTAASTATGVTSTYTGRSSTGLGRFSQRAASAA